MQPLQPSDTGYVSYMLRMWSKRDSNGKQVWCASLEEPGSRRTERFEDANAMFAFLRRKLGTGQPGEREPQGHQAP